MKYAPKIPSKQKGENMMKRFVFILMLIVIPTGCAPATDVPASTETPIPTTTSPAAVPTSTEFHVDITPSPLPAEPTIPPMMTPDTYQVEHWQEYQTELAKAILPMFPVETVLCEWDILARSGQEVYVWAVCASSDGDDMRPAVVHLNSDGSIHSIEIPKRGSESDIDRIFSKEAQVKLSLYMGNSNYEMIKVLYSHIKYRKTYPEEPPLIVLWATPIATPVP